MFIFCAGSERGSATREASAAADEGFDLETLPSGTYESAVTSVQSNSEVNSAGRKNVHTMDESVDECNGKNVANGGGLSCGDRGTFCRSL